MKCKRCASDGLQAFPGELAIHFPGLDNLTKPHVMVFPQLIVCLNCGFVEFVLPDAEIEQLRNGLGTAALADQLGGSAA